MADEVSTISVVAVSDQAQDVLDETPSSASPSPSPKVAEPSGGEDHEADMQDGAPRPFQERMDEVRDSFRETYQEFGSTTSGAREAKTELDKAQTVYDGKVVEVSHAATSNLEATRCYIRILQEHEAVLVGHGQA